MRALPSASAIGGLLAPGARPLPSVRQCAQQQGVSPSTVVAAYDQLLALGLVEARKNRGFLCEIGLRPENIAQAAIKSGAGDDGRGGLQLGPPCAGE